MEKFKNVKQLVEAIRTCINNVADISSTDANEQAEWRVKAKNLREECAVAGKNLIEFSRLMGF